LIVTITANSLHQLKDAQGTIIAESANHQDVVNAAYLQPAGNYTIETANEAVLVEDEPPPPPPPTDLEARVAKLEAWARSFK